MKHSRHKNRLSQLGASLVEFSVLVALISVICIISVRSLGTHTLERVNNSANWIGSPEEIDAMAGTGPW